MCVLFTSGLKGRVNLKTVSALWVLHLQCLNSLKTHRNIIWERCWRQYAKFLWFIPQPLVAESGHSRDKLVTAIVFIGSSSFQFEAMIKGSYTVLQLRLPCVFSFEGGHNWAIWLWIISAIQRERERDITCCHDNKRWCGVYLNLNSAQGFTSSRVWRSVCEELFLRQLIPPFKHLLCLCSFTPGYVEDASLKAQPRTEQMLLFPKGTL